MISVYRLVSPKWTTSALSGEGARLYGGRWNSPGRPMVYLGSSRALTALELLVHLTTPASRAKSYAFTEITLPREGVKMLPKALLADDWKDSPPGKSTQALGDEWLEDGTSLGLWVPSALIPEERNLLVNPRHPSMALVKSSAATSFTFDMRLQ